MEKFYITTAIAYTNGSPHMGHILEFVQADVIARHRRQKGADVFFLTGTDEHGTKIYRKAQEQQKDVKEFVDSIAQEFINLKDENILNLSWNDFIRTSDQKNHWPGVYKIWQELEKSGDIYPHNYSGLYCVGCEAFVTEKDLVDGKCPDHQKEPELVEEKNYFFKLSKYADEIEKAIESDEVKIIPQSRKNEILSFIKEGVKDISVSRPKEKLPWGIPVPNDQEQVIYVWLDALTNYISAIGYGKENEVEKFNYYWPADVQLIGKDILRFHAVIWLGMLLSAKLPLPKNIIAHGFITSNGQKMSKSLGNVIDPVELIKKYGTDSIRYYLLREIPSQDDGDYSEQKFKERYNGELANGLGNLYARVLTLAQKAEFEISKDEFENHQWHKNCEQVQLSVDQKMNEYKFHEALGFIWSLVNTGDGIMTAEKPWENLNNKKDTIIKMLITLKNIAQMLEPFLPKTAQKISKSIDSSDEIIKIEKVENLFPRL